MLKFLSKYKKDLIIGPIFKLIEAIIEVFLPFIIAQIINNLSNTNTNTIIKYTGIMLILIIIGLACAVIAQYIAAKTSQVFGTELRNKLFSHVLKLSNKQIEKYGTSAIVNRITNDILNLEVAVAMFIRLVIRVPFIFIGSLIMVYVLDSTISKMLFVSTVILAVCIYVIIKKASKYQQKANTKLDEIALKVKENLLNIRLVKSFGTEKLEEYIKDAFPTARVIRMDADSVSNKGSHAKVTEAFASGKYDILLGTQMISKGLDFPNVTLVGIINADASLNIPDYQSNERTFELLCQASGRSGRGEKKGEVFIQTYNPETPIFTFVKNHDYKKFFLYEMNIRKTLKYPPYYYLCFLKVKSKDYKQAIDEARKIKAYLDKNLTQDFIVLGPATANMFLVNGVYNFEIYIKYKKEEKLYQVLKELDKLMLVNSKVQLDIDFLE